LVPRWRPLSATIAAGELGIPGKKANSALLPPDLIDRAQRWRLEKTLVAAAELTEASLVHAREPEALHAAQFLVRRESGATPGVRAQAAEILRRVGFEMDVPPDLVSPSSALINVWRGRTRLYPRDALSWVDLALSQLNQRANQNAERSMIVALQLAPNNRHVLRSAARFYLHQHDEGRAHDVIRRNEATPHDPWLMAAEVALAACAERDPKYSKRGLAVVDAGQHLPRQITELAGALGTLYMGDRKRSKRLFSTSVVDPTGNALAQAEWASRQLGEQFVALPQLTHASDAREALSLHSYHVGDFQGSLQWAAKWIEEEPFACGPYRAAAAAACVLEDYKQARKFAETGLLHDPDARDLQNTRAFSLACVGLLDEAESILRALAPDPDNKLSASVTEANRGLIAFRRGQHLRGFTHYRDAMLGFRREHNVELETVAFAYMVREAVYAGVEEAMPLLEEAKKRNAKRPRENVKAILESAQAALGARRAAP